MAVQRLQWGKCVFAESETGGKAQVHQRKPQCLFCNMELLAQQCSTQTGRSKALTSLRMMLPTSRQKAVEERVPEEHRKYFQDALAVRAGGGRCTGSTAGQPQTPCSCNGS